MTVIANLVIGIDGSTTVDGRSKGLSSNTDRQRFHQLRNQVDVIVIGGKTARLEPYQKTPTQLVVVTREEKIESINENPLAEIWNLEPKEAIKKALIEFGSKVLIEAGPNFLLEVVDLVDELYITITSTKGDGQVVSFDGLTRDFVMEDKEEISGETFYRFKRLR